MYRVINAFVDLHDADHEYAEGDIFPRDGIRVSEKRIQELSGKKNRRGIPLIEKIMEEPAQKHEET